MSQIYNNTTTSQPRSQLTFDTRWSSGLCECSDLRNCCCAYWCFPCFLCKLDNAAHECPCTTVGICYLGGFNTGLGILRAKIRGSYKIQGSVIEDYCCSFWLPCCTALQIYRELQNHGEA